MNVPLLNVNESTNVSRHGSDLILMHARGNQSQKRLSSELNM